MIFWRLVREGYCKSYVDIPLGATAVEVNGREVVGLCEECQKPILLGQLHTDYADGVVVCSRCETPTAPAPEGEDG